ncbi:hypothetical protein V8G54_004963 [Vigna mungo]|uniref:Uncharacterized protein n=1 Tax=Vigna mungo TaxID=3915 RepID=A0AAQ3SGP8_VIGMU
MSLNKVSASSTSPTSAHMFSNVLYKIKSIGQLFSFIRCHNSKASLDHLAFPYILITAVRVFSFGTTPDSIISSNRPLANPGLPAFPIASSKVLYTTKLGCTPTDSIS